MYHRAAVSIGCGAIAACRSASFPVIKTARSFSRSCSAFEICRLSQLGIESVAQVRILQCREERVEPVSIVRFSQPA